MKEIWVTPERKKIDMEALRTNKGDMGVKSAAQGWCELKILWTSKLYAAWSAGV